MIPKIKRVGQDEYLIYLDRGTILQIEDKPLVYVIDFERAGFVATETYIADDWFELEVKHAQAFFEFLHCKSTADLNRKINNGEFILADFDDADIIADIEAGTFKKSGDS